MSRVRAGGPSALDRRVSLPDGTYGAALAKLRAARCTHVLADQVLALSTAAG